jgi:metal-sulfur cluster biosynthetic enzyme
MPPTKEQVLEALKEVYDPEIPFNIVDLGLVYGCDVLEDGTVKVQMTLTFPGCGMGPYIANNAKEKILELSGVEDAQVEMVFDPPWTPDRISDEIKQELGIQ